MQLIILPTGQILCLYSEELELDRLGRLSITRGSHVEPDPEGRWIADLSPAGGPRLGPYRIRSDALEAERDWLKQHWLVPPQ